MNERQAAVAVAAKLGSPFKVWASVFGWGRMDRTSPPGASMELHATKELAIEAVRAVLTDRFVDNLDEEVDGPDARIEDIIQQALVDDYIYEDEYDSWCAIRELEVKA